ncbi:flagellar protein FlgN [Bacillaceae bacterium SIJ1]|uniref:flagellar protein FlgN n=1 Tax=Litoribacterium kuwaitense TaxID=1398745 RepID=UPI0013E9A257|nr:flagellar protein FlgN [Litoribacterium kuwaitense]NGP44941.1 flagellar protein FlgN [Litoribacterium kuwaitense]
MTIVEMLQQLHFIHIELLEIARSKRVVLLENNMERLQEMTAREKVCIDQVNAIWKHMQENGMHHIEHGLSDMEPDAEQAARGDLAQLLETMNTLRLLNDENQKLVEQSLHFVHQTIDWALPPATDYTYDPNQQTTAPPIRTFDSKA